MSIKRHHCFGAASFYSYVIPSIYWGKNTIFCIKTLNLVANIGVETG